MTALILLGIAGGHDAAAELQRCRQAYQIRSAYAVVASATITRMGKPQRQQWELEIAQNGTAARLVVPGRTEIVAKSGKVIWLDRTLQQYRELNVAKTFDLSEAISHTGFPLDDLQASLLARGGAAKMVSDLMELKGWTAAQESSGVRLRCVPKGSQKIELLIDRDSALIRSLSISNAFDGKSWSLTYRKAPSRIVFSAPGLARRVRDFDPEARPSTYVDEAARKLCSTLFRKYDGIRSADYVVTTPAGRTRCVIDGGRIRQVGPGYDWSYDGSQLRVVLSRKKHIYVGAAGTSKVIESVAATGSPIDPMLRGLWQRENPARKWLGSGMRIRLAGAATLQGEQVELLEATRPGVTLHLQIRKRDGILLGVLVTGSSGTGLVGNTQYRWVRIGGRAKAGDLSVKAPAGFSTAELSALPKP